MGMHIVVAGNIADGFTFYGPFATADEAIEQADRNLDCEWVAVPISAITEPAHELSDIV